MTNFTIQFTGTGSAFALKNYNNGALITINGKKYLLDCGFTIPFSLRDMNISMGDIDGVIITHVHADHTGGLEALGFHGMYVFNKKYDLYVAEDLIERLWDKTLAGGMEEISGAVGTLESFFNVKTYKHLQSFNIEGLDIVPIKTTHVIGPNGITVKPSYSFIFDHRVFYSGDMVFNEELLLSMSEMEVIFHDCQLFHLPAPDGVHASIDELETLPDVIRTKIKVMHYGDNFEKFEERFEKASIERVKQFQTFKF